MYGLGTIINVGAIIVGGLLGILFGRFIGERHREALCKACGLAVIFIGVGGALKGMLSVVDGKIVYGGDFLIIGCLALGALIGELVNIEGGFERFGEWLKRKTKSTGDNNFIEGFVSASFTVCIGAMAIVGSINDGLYGDYTVLVTKSGGFPWQGNYILCPACGTVTGWGDGSFRPYQAYYDGHCSALSFSRWQYFDFLCRYQPSVWQKDKGGKPVARHYSCCFVFTPACAANLNLHFSEVDFCYIKNWEKQNDTCDRYDRLCWRKDNGVLS